MQRIITAVIVLPFLIASFLISWLQPLFVAMAAAALVLGLYEFYVLARKKDIKPDIVAGFLGGAAIFTIFYFASPYPGTERLDVHTILLVILLLIVGTLIAATLRGAPYDKMITSTSATILGVLYVVLLGSHLVAVRTGFPHALAADLLSFFFLILAKARPAPSSAGGSTCYFCAETSLLFNGIFRNCPEITCLRRFAVWHLRAPDPKPT